MQTESAPFSPPITSATAAPAQAALLAWYDRHARALPWRIGPADRARGVMPDPYRVWLSEVMLQQTTVAAAGRYFHAFTRAWPRVEALAAAPREAVLEAWAGLGYYARARNLHACAGVVAAEHGGRFPETEDGLRALPGIGAYTAAAIAAIAFDRPAAVVDGNIERVMARLFAETEPLPGVKPRLRAHAAALTPAQRPGDHAQALMDLGATICTPRRPACALCPLRPGCAAHAAGIAGELPARAPKLARPVRHGHVWAALDGQGAVWVVRRPPSGLLGGMLALPSSDWTAAPGPDPLPPVPGAWEAIGEVRHVFTHFALRLTVHRARIDPLPGPGRERAAAADAMPTVFAKALRLIG
ncbi:A/G-specific adenine glycosylase [Paralimibaculum aggregatum]|uniref:Adenine DNA glycosylase n=1 Tax=Paralimibaculum aggregatum TaxID=3036245 RepID=A0ABQ6LQP4_9RHOB|nr:A/G-specific adenine glycosylase [Limibaculum sp. NKW23]GMG82975.1 A/G-specific adenine glycosylase [Limibaculum sp. NKW23]